MRACSACARPGGDISAPHVLHRLPGGGRGLLAGFLPHTHHMPIRCMQLFHSKLFYGPQQVAVNLLAGARPDELARLAAAPAGAKQALALFRRAPVQRVCL